MTEANPGTLARVKLLREIAAQKLWADGLSARVRKFPLPIQKDLREELELLALQLNKV